MTTLKQCLDTSIDFSEGFMERLATFSEQHNLELDSLPCITQKYYKFEDFERFTTVRPIIKGGPRYGESLQHPCVDNYRMRHAILKLKDAPTRQ